MNLITRDEILKHVIGRYRKQYPYKRQFKNGKDSETIYYSLLNEKNPTVEKFNEIIGNDSWTRNICYECNKDKEEIVEFGVNDYEESYYRICKDCLNKAIDKFK